MVDNIKNAANAVTEKITGTEHATAKDAHKNAAESSELGIGDRVSHAGSAVTEGLKQSNDETKHEVHKEAAKPNNNLGST